MNIKLEKITKGRYQYKFNTIYEVVKFGGKWVVNQKILGCATEICTTRNLNQAVDRIESFIHYGFIPGVKK